MQNEQELREYLAELERQLLDNPTDCMVRYNLGVAYGMMGLAEKAIAAYGSAIRINPS